MSRDANAKSAPINPLEMFISCAGPAGRRVAESLEGYLKSVFSGMTLRVSPMDIRNGADWMRKIGGDLTTVGTGIVIVTPDALKAPWFFFEAGALASEVLSEGSSKAALHPYLVGVKGEALASTPLDSLFAVDATKKGTMRLVRSIVKRAESLGLQQYNWESHAEMYWPELAQSLAKIQEDFDLRFELSRLGRDIGSASLDLVEGASKGEASSFRRNPYLQTVVLRSLEGELKRLKRLRSSNDPFFSIPHNLYPAYLYALLHKFQDMPIDMEAIALVDRDESFWQQMPAFKILEVSTQSCRRVFAFEDVDHMRPYLKTIKNHAGRYKVHAISMARIQEIFPEPYDFSICGDGSSGNAILARYKHDPSESWMSHDKSTKTIAFYSDRPSISKHQGRFKEVVRASVRIDKDSEDGEILNAVFRPETISRPATRSGPVEMSAYIEIVNYKKHEGKHAYYPEMHAQMLAHLQDRRGELGSQRMTVLELGAGTGHFTVQLAGTGNLDITTIEVDWACFNALKDTLEELEGTEQAVESKSLGKEQSDWKRYVTRDLHFSIPDLNVGIHCHCEDAREFDPGGPEGKFHCIVSSFADHHIAHADKEAYFDNVKANLEPGGVFIVGDEFLPPHDAGSPEARKSALRSYHGHIIEKTRELHGAEAEGLVELEEGALDSGLREIGDFKLTCEAYEGHLEKAGFSFSKVRVGPAEDSVAQQVGGVYVYVMRVL